MGDGDAGGAASAANRLGAASRLGVAYRRWASGRRLTDLAEVHAWAVKSIRRQRYCIVVTVSDGISSARVVEPFRPDRHGIVRFGTDPSSRKVNDIREDGTCLLVYQDNRRRSCVSIECSASIEPQTARPRFKPLWTAFWPDGPGRDYVVISCIPQAMEIWAGYAVIAPDPFGRRSLRLERRDGEWVAATREG